jgi:hypothetical protein
MKDYYKIVNDRISALIKRVLNPDLNSNERIKIITIITIDVHGRGTVNRFAQLKVSDTTSF